MVQHFLNLPQSPIEAADIIITGIPYEGGISYLPGASKGPQAILNASEQLELFDLETKIDLSKVKVHTTELPSRFHQFREMALHQQQIISQLELSRQFYLGIGGDHSVSIPTIEAFCDKYNHFGIVQIDAHADLRDSYNNSKFSHACIMRRIGEMIGFQNILSVGIRAICDQEWQFIQQEKILHIPGNQGLSEDLLPEFSDKLAKLPENIFLTIDLDGLDPSAFPDVGTPVPGGLSWRQMNNILTRLFARKNVIGADIVEIASNDTSHKTDFAAALLAQKVISHHLKKS